MRRMALMMPYGAFHLGGRGVRATTSTCLRSRFGVSFEQAANRLITLAARRRCRRAVLHDGDRQRGQPTPRVSARRVSRRRPSAARVRSLPCMTLSPQPGQSARRSGRDAGRRRLPDRSPARLKVRRAASRSVRAAPRSCSAATSPFAIELVYGAAVRPATAGCRSAPPAGCANASAAWRAPNRRSRDRSGSTRW